MDEPTDPADWTLSRPTSDSYTNEWYRKQFAALSHYFQSCLAEVVEMAAQFRRLRKEVDDIAKPRRDDMAKIGELQSRIEAMELQRIEDASRIDELVARVDKARDKVMELQRERKAN